MAKSGKGGGQAGKRRGPYRKSRKTRNDAKWRFVAYRTKVHAENDGANDLVLTNLQFHHYAKNAKNEWVVEQFLKNHRPLAACFGVLEHDDSGSDEPGIREPDWRWVLNQQTYFGVTNCKSGARCPHCVNFSRTVTSNSAAFRRETLSPIDRGDRPVFRSEGVSPRHYPGYDPPPPSP